MGRTRYNSTIDLGFKTLFFLTFLQRRSTIRFRGKAIIFVNGLPYSTSTCARISGISFRNNRKIVVFSCFRGRQLVFLPCRKTRHTETCWILGYAKVGVFIVTPFGKLMILREIHISGQIPNKSQNGLDSHLVMAQPCSRPSSSIPLVSDSKVSHSQSKGDPLYE